MKQARKKKSPETHCFKALAEEVGFEPTHQLPRSTPLAGEPLIATWVFLHMCLRVIRASTTFRKRADMLGRQPRLTTLILT